MKHRAALPRALSGLLLVLVISGCEHSEVRTTPLGMASASLPEAAEYRMLFETSEAGKPTIVSARRDLPEWALRGKYRWVVEIAWRYPEADSGPALSPRLPEDNASFLASRPNAPGMPGLETRKQLNALNEMLRQKLVTRRLALPPAVIRTGNGARQWLYYVASPQIVDDEIVPIVRSVAGSSATVKAREDSEWRAFRDFLSTVPTRHK